MSLSNSDYSIPFNGVQSNVPEVLQNALSNAITSNTFDRFYSKPEFQQVIGTIGTPVLSTNDRIVEDTIFDQAYQLQPIISNAATTVTEYTTYSDIARACAQLGINLDDVTTWQNTEQFNYCVPIDLDKLINYNEYYWVGSSTPQYIGIQSPYIKLQTQLTQQVVEYLASANKAALWINIEHNLNLIKTVVPEQNQVTIRDLDLVLNDLTNHGPYTYQPVGNPYDYQCSDWSVGNMWIHRTVVNDISSVVQATLPIIEYASSLQMTQWTYTKAHWKYRASPAVPFADVDARPTNEELITRYTIIAADPTSSSFTIAGNYTSKFVADFEFIIEQSPIFDAIWKTVSSTFDGTNTTIIVDTAVISNVASGVILPFTFTSLGDRWLGSNQQWMYAGTSAAVPTLPPTALNANANLAFIEIATAGQTIFVDPINSFLPGTNTLRVYVNGRRQYGTYEEGSILGATNSIRFYKGLQAGDVVNIFVYAMAATDAGLESVVVRTSETDPGVTQSVCLVEYRLQEQYRTSSNQYPLFDMVDVNGNTTFKSSNVFSFVTNQSAPVVPAIGLRLVRDTSTNDYTYQTSLVNADGTLNFIVDNNVGTIGIWRKDTSGTQYVPKLVDGNRNPTTLTSTPDAVYEIPMQFQNNVHHAYRNVIKHSELFLHFTSIINNQQNVDASLYGTNLPATTTYRLLDTINYGAGGTIKEYNYGFDQFVSSMISTDNTVLDVLHYAEDQYGNMLAAVCEYVQKNVATQLQGTDPVLLSSPATFIADQFITYLNDDIQLYQLFGDSSVSTQSGLPNWIATLPYLNLSKSVQPEYLNDPRLGINQLIHHDGHSALAELNAIVSSVTFQSIVKAFSLVASSVQPVNPTPGQFWYNSNDNQIWRFNVASVGSTLPDVNVLDGSWWLNTTTDAMYRLINGNWTLTTATANSMWAPFDVTRLVIDVLTIVEQTLFESAPKGSLATDGFASQAQATTAYQQAMELEFNSFCNDNNITNPTVGDYDASDAFTWDYSSLTVGGITGIARWYDIYTALYNTPYPHLQPWKLQGYKTKPNWWDGAYAGTNRRWSSQMWANINAGIVPAGQYLPHYILSTGAANSVPPIAKTSVNTTNNTTVDGVEPDGLFPPYRILMTDGTSGQVLLAPASGSAADAHIISITKNNVYPFGTNGPSEYLWKQSISYNYAVLRSLFLADPVRFVHYTFGEQYDTVEGFRISTRNGKAFSHHDVIFHGDPDEYGNTLYFNGLNQLYVQFLRSNSLDLSGNEFKRAWTSWTTNLGYDTGSFVIDNTLQVTSSNTDITSSDYKVVTKQSSHVRDLFVDGLYIDIFQMGSKKEIPNGSGRDWKFTVSTVCPITRAYSYFNVKKYSVIANPTNNVFTMQTGGMQLAGWTTGSPIVFDTGMNGILPNAVDNLTYYYLIVVSDNTFMIADSEINAITGNNIILGSASYGTIYIGELLSTYNALAGANTSAVWRKFAINTNDVKTFNSGIVITGVQNLADLVDGYSAYLAMQGFGAGDGSVQNYDPVTNRVINWQFALESAIDQLYSAVYLSGGVGASPANVLFNKVRINPIEQLMWISTPTGVVSEMNGSDTNALGNRAFVYDTEGKRINLKHYNVIRQDTQTLIAIAGVNLDVVQITSNLTPYNLSPYRIGGAHIFFDEYNQVILFNSYTVSGDIIYDGFLGITLPRARVFFQKQINPTKRPNVGGFVYNNGAQTQNYEYTVSNMQKYYDTFTVNENSDFVNYARDLVGYQPNQSYMTVNNITPKSQFLFYKGLIKVKGTVASINAFTNNIQLGAATLDEFWAYRSYNFGDNRANVQYYMNLLPTDTQYSASKFEFITSGDADNGFVKISNNDQTRWRYFPTQVQTLSATPPIFTMKAVNIVNNVPFSVLYNHSTVNLIKHEYADDIVVYKAALGNKVTSYASNGIINLGYNYIQGANSLAVYIDGQLATLGAQYQETTETSITLMQPFKSSSVVVIIPQNSVLVENEHYVRLNSRVIKLLVNDTSGITVATYAPDYSASAPIKIYDHASNTTICDIMPWDPLNGLNSSNLELMLDVSADTDPAGYNASPDVSSVIAPTNFWADDQVGKVWLDTSTVGYVPYSDLTNSVNDKLLKWGTLAQWSDPAVYQWVKTSIAPSKWISSGTTTGTPLQYVYTRSRNQFTVTVSGNTWTTPTAHGFQVGDDLIVTATSPTGALPSPLKPSTIYTLSSGTNNTFVLSDNTGNVINLTNAGIGPFVVSEASYSGEWTKVEALHHKVEALEVNFTNGTLVTTLPAGQEYGMYANGLYVQDGLVPPNQVIVLEPETLALIANMPANFELELITKTGVLGGVATTKPVDLDLTTSTFQEYVDTPMVMMNTNDHVSGANVPTYYYWVRGIAEPLPGGYTTTSELERMISVNTNPYLICMKPSGGLNKIYSQLILCGVNGKVSDINRYSLVLFNNETLRNTPINSQGSLLKPVYSEWRMFRQNQDTSIDRALWNMVIESIVGYSIVPGQSNIAIPSLDRVIYDQINGTATQYGMNAGQAFVNGQQALNTIVALLNSPTIDYSPIDMDSFLSTHDITTNTGIITFMDDLYNSLPGPLLNTLFFSVMMDALSNSKADYSTCLMKTSGIALTGIAPLNVNGALDE